MRFGQSVLMAILAGVSAVEAGCTQDGGNYYCSETDKVIYKGVGFSGSYKDVTNMDESSGSCSQDSKSFSGSLSPLDEELSVHFRGPLKLLQFGVYYPSSGSSSKAKRDDEDCEIRHVHHKHKRATAVVDVTQTVYVDGSGHTITSSGTETSSTSSADSDDAQGDQGEGKAFITVSSTAPVASSTEAASSSSESPDSTSSDSSDSTSSAAAGDWVRTSYYTPGSTDNVTFFNYYGGSGSGTWSSSFGNSLSFANSDASGGSSKAVALEETTIASDVEYVVMSSSECSGNDCGYYRDGTPAYHGFDGKHKIFVFEFEMPTATDDASTNKDMPAIWLLNAKIPRTLQYGDESCSCWKSGCGELDLFEILSEGSDKLISHLHDGQGDDGTSSGGGGSQDYFSRPTSGSLKAAVVFNGDEIHILSVDDDFSSSLSSSTVNDWLDKSGSTANLS